MTDDKKRKYAKQYRLDGYGRCADARYRAKWLEKIRAKDRERKARNRREGGTTP